LIANKIEFEKATTGRAKQPGIKAAMELEEIQEIEQRLDSEKIVDDALKSMQIIELARLNKVQS
jgi:hypothetical protein